MKFKVRNGFAVHLESIVEQFDGNRKLKHGKVDSHYSGEVIDITEADARRHLHKLEPADKDARALFEVEYEKGRVIANNRLRADVVSPEFVAAVAAALRANPAA